jgi:hypothetical protein
MSITQPSEFQGVLARVQTWTPEMRLTLAEELLRSLHPVLRPSEPRGVQADQVRGLAAGGGPPPDDDTVQQWIHERRLEKYG